MGRQSKPQDVSVHMLVWNDFCNDARVLKEAQTLQAAGYRVVVHALHVSGKTREHEVLNEGIEVCRVRTRRLGLMSAKPEASNGFFSLVRQVMSRLWAHFSMLRHLIADKPTVIHAHDVNTLPTAWLASRISGAKLVYDAHEISTSREGYSGLRKLVGVVEKLLMPSAVATITTTDARAKFFRRAYGVPRPLVLQNRPRLQSLKKSTRIRDELALEQQWPIIVYQGGVQSGRGLERLVRAAAQVPNAYFVFIGGGRLDSNLRAIAIELGLEQRVRFIPTVALADLPSYTASADIGVQPIENTCLNHFTTDSNKLFEYVQAGLPVVASDLPEIRRVIRAHDLGMLVSPGDTSALVAALNALVSNEPLRLRYSVCAAQAAAELSWESQEHELLSLYTRVLSAKL